MEKHFKRKSSMDEGSSTQDNLARRSQSHVEINLEDLEVDPAERKNISEFNVNDRDVIRRRYLQIGPYQPKNYMFPKRTFGKEQRRFNPSWFEEHVSWLEYKISGDAAYCLYCYLFKHYHGNQGGGEAFVTVGFTNWKKALERLRTHVGTHNSIHHRCRRACEDLMNQKQHIEVCVGNHSAQVKKEYRIRLTASVDCIRWLLRQDLPLRGHDESDESTNRGNFLEFLKFLADHNKEISDVVLKNATENLQLTSPRIQKDIVNAATCETTILIINDLGSDFFGILVDESRDISIKEQMIVSNRYVDVKGNVVERFLATIHVHDTTSQSLKPAITNLLMLHGLTISNIRGQGYDGASNMRGEFNGLKTLILNENSSAFYVHCFAHQLQLALVAVAREDKDVSSFFCLITQLSNIICVSCKRRDKLRQKQVEKLAEEISLVITETGSGLNQEMTIKCPGDTRWGSHYKSILGIIILFSSITKVLEELGEDANDSKHKGDATNLLRAIECFDFVFFLHLMKNILAITDELSQTLQKKDQNIVNAMTLVSVSKRRLQIMQETGWEALIQEVSSFCGKHEISVLNMDEVFIPEGRSRRKGEKKSNLHRYRVERFCVVLDQQLQELNNRFSEINTELLLCMACFDPRSSFSMFNKDKLLRLATFYPNEFSNKELMVLDSQLQTYIIDVKYNIDFSKLTGVAELAQKIVTTRRHMVYPLVYLLMKLVLILPIVTASVERAFSAMKLINT